MPVRQSNNKGYVLPMVMIIMMAVVILGLALANLSLASARSGIINDKKMQSYYIAKSGAEAVAQYMIDNPAFVSSLPNSASTSNWTQFKNGSSQIIGYFQVTITPDNVTPASVTYYTVLSTGKVSSGATDITTLVSVRMFGNAASGLSWNNAIWNKESN